MAWIFEWDGGHPALDFLNTLDERRSAAPLERLPDFAALASFAHQAKLIGATTAAVLMRRAGKPEARTIWTRSLALREAVYRIVLSRTAKQAPTDRDVAAVNAELRLARGHRELKIGPRRSDWTWDSPGSLELPIWEVAIALEQLLTACPGDRIRKCRADDCGTVFFDGSKTGRRKWCSMTNCGNRSKVRRFRAKAPR